MMNDYQDTRSKDLSRDWFQNSDEINIKNIIVLAAAAFSIIAPPVILCMLSVMAAFMLLGFLF